jgi:hypothetical protein
LNREPSPFDGLFGFLNGKNIQWLLKNRCWTNKTAIFLGSEIRGFWGKTIIGKRICPEILKDN